MKKLVILGGSGIGMLAASIANDLGCYDVIGFLNDVVEKDELIGKFKKFPVIGKTTDLKHYLTMKDYYFFIAYVGLKNEKDTYEKIIELQVPPERFASLIHPTAIIPKGMCTIGNGVLFAPLSQLSPDTTISDNCILLGNSFVGHDSFLAHFAHIATNSVVGANVKIGKAVHIGSNATIREKITIGDFALIGAGSVVLRNVETNSVIIGNPGRVLEKRH